MDPGNSTYPNPRSATNPLTHNARRPGVRRTAHATDPNPARRMARPQIHGWGNRSVRVVSRNTRAGTGMGAAAWARARTVCLARLSLTPTTAGMVVVESGGGRITATAITAATTGGSNKANVRERLSATM